MGNCSLMQCSKYMCLVSKVAMVQDIRVGMATQNIKTCEQVFIWLSIHYPIKEYTFEYMISMDESWAQGILDYIINAEPCIHTLVCTLFDVLSIPTQLLIPFFLRVC